MSRKQALQNGEKIYHGKPCKNCGTTAKFTSNWGCVKCAAERNENPDVRKRYEQSDKGKRVRKKINASNAQKERIRLYNASSKGKATTSRFYENNPDKFLEYRTKKYGITPDQYNQLLTEQQYCCKVCGVHESELAKSLAIDHCHTHGHVRALLCTNCNTALGLLKENTDIMKKLIEYTMEYCE